MANAAISWMSHKQKTVAISSTEEYVALSEATKKAFDGIPVRNSRRTVSNYNLQRQPRSWQHRLKPNLPWTKHVHLRYHFIREVIKKKEITVPNNREDDGRPAHKRIEHDHASTLYQKHGHGGITPF